MKRLTLNEQIFLIAIWLLKDEAYGVKIRKKITELTGSSILFGTLYNTLDYLVKKGYVSYFFYFFDVVFDIDIG